MPRLPGSVRARTAVGATVVVAIALVAVGFAVVAVLRGNLVGQAELRAEVTAREVASKIAGGSSYGSLDLDDDDPVQVVAADGKVLNGSGVLDTHDAVTDINRPPATADDSRGKGRGHDDHEGGDDSPRGRGDMAPGAMQTTIDLAAADGGGRTGPYQIAAVQVAPPDRDETVTVYAAVPLSGERQAVDDVVRSMLFGLPLLLAVVAGVTWLVTRRALRPVEAIRSELAAIAVGDGSGRAGDLTRRVPEPGSRDEVARLARTTNETLAVLEESVGRQRRFVADASHELRSPIASLRTQLEVAAAHPGLLEMDGLLEDVVRLQHLAADLLLLARLDAGDGAAGAAVDMALLVREEIAQRASGDRIRIAAKAEAEAEERVPAAVYGSRSRLQRVLGNLLDNAQRHADSAVTVGLRRERGAVVLAVADDGPGVPAGERERIFERFVRLDDARSRDDGGAGLGLAIARDIVAMHGGSLTVRDAPGGGALFEVRLPLAEEDGRPGTGGRGRAAAGRTDGWTAGWLESGLLEGGARFARRAPRAGARRPGSAPDAGLPAPRDSSGR